MSEDISEARLAFDSLSEIQKACEIAKRATSCGREVFLEDGSLQNAAAMALVRVGQASSNLWKHAPSFKENHLEWPWDEIRNVRNALTHEYAIMIPRNIWDAVTILLVTLLEKEIKPELARLNQKYPQFSEETVMQERASALLEILERGEKA